MPNLILRRPAPPQVPDPNKALNQQLARIQHRGIASMARLQVAGFVAQFGMQHTANLSAAASRAFQHSPHAESEYQAIVSTYGYLVLIELQGLGAGGGA